MMRHLVCQLNDVADGTIKAIQIDGRELMLVRKGRQIFALRDVCPHQGAKLSTGVLSGAAVAEQIGQYRFVKCGKIVRCPWHNWEFDATDGTCLHDPHHIRVATYGVEVEDDQVFVVM